MNDLKLIFNTKCIPLKFGSSPDEVCKILEIPIVINEEDRQTVRHELPEDGIEICYSGNRLDAVFIYIKDDYFKSFRGEIKYLGMNFFSNPSGETFSEILSNFGFNYTPKKYPYSVDLMNDSFRYKFYQRGDYSYVYIDDGALLR